MTWAWRVFWERIILIHINLSSTARCSAWCWWSCVRLSNNFCSRIEKGWKDQQLCNEWIYIYRIFLALMWVPQITTKILKWNLSGISLWQTTNFARLHLDAAKNPGNHELVLWVLNKGLSFIMRVFQYSPDNTAPVAWVWAGFAPVFHFSWALALLLHIYVHTAPTCATTRITSNLVH
jgi:hypothetical protein